MFGLIAPVLMSALGGLALGGSLEHWAAHRLRWWPLALLALGVQIPLYSPPLDTWPPLIAVGAAVGIASTGLVLLVLLRNAVKPLRAGLLLAAVGITLNLTVMLANGGWMPRIDALGAGLRDRGTETSTISNTAPFGPETRLAWLADTIVQPAWLPLANIVSPGDMLLSLGAAWWAFVLTRPARLDRLKQLAATFTSPRLRPTRRDSYIAGLLLAAVGLFAGALANGTAELWNLWGAMALFGAMLLAERLSVFVPRGAKVSVATIPHIVAVLLLPPWVAMALAGGAMLADQIAARAVLRKTVFNVASIVLTVGVAALLADRVGLYRESLGQPEQWLQLPAFLLVAATYYCMTNGLAAIVISLDGREPAWRIFLDTTSFTLPAEFAVCGMGGLVALLWVLSPAWAPVILFPAVVSQVALSYISSSKRSHARLVFLAEASRILGLSLDKDEMPDRVAELAVATLADACLMYLIGDDGALQQAAHACRWPAPGAPATGSSLDLTPWVSGTLAEGRPVLIAELRDEDRRALAPEAEQHHALSQLGLQSLMSVPLLASGHLLGALVFLSSGRHFEVDDLALAEDLARRCAVALDNARLHAEAQRASRLRDEFLSVAAHELKTPLTTLRGYAQLLGSMLENEGPLEPNLLAKGFRAIDMQSEKLGRLASQLMDVSRVESGKLQLDRRDVDVSALVRSLVMGVQAGTDRHVMQVRVSDSCIVSVDPLRVEQVVSNLLSNAVKYSPAGGHIDVTLQRIGRSAISLKVRDWGVGIPPERRAQLFDRFYQAHGEGHFGGLGLGLYISRQIVELHGGRIAVEFPPDGGTCFVMELPVGAAEPTDESVDSATGPPEPLARAVASSSANRASRVEAKTA